MKAELPNGITVLWDGRTRVYITAPPEFINKTMGRSKAFMYFLFYRIGVQNNLIITLSLGWIETERVISETVL